MIQATLFYTVREDQGLTKRKQAKANHKKRGKTLNENRNLSDKKNKGWQQEEKTLRWPKESKLKLTKRIKVEQEQKQKQMLTKGENL